MNSYAPQQDYGCGWLALIGRKCATCAGFVLLSGARPEGKGFDT